MRERKAQYDLAAKGLRQCEQLRDQAEKRLGEHDDARAQLQSAQKGLRELELELRATEEKKLQAEQAESAARDVAHAANQTLTQHRQDRTMWETRKRLVTVQRRQQGLREKIDQYGRHENERQPLGRKLVGPPVLPEARINELRHMRDQCGRLRAQLEAAEIHVTVRVHESLKVAVVADDEVSKEVDLAANKEQVWLVRQHAELQIGGHATIRIGRGRENRDLDTLARELRDAESTLHLALSAAQVDPTDATALDQLVERRLQNDEHIKRLKSLREQIALVAPEGELALKSQSRKPNPSMRQFGPSTGVATWSPDQVELDRLRSDFDLQEDKLKVSADDAFQLLNRASKELASRSEMFQSLQTRLATQTVITSALDARVVSTDREKLVEERDQAVARVTEARRKLQESTLTPEQESLEAQFESARVAHANRAERLRQNENLLAELRGQLMGGEGLHQKRIDAEQTVNDRSRELERESLHASAHRHLKELFERVHQEQVRRTVGPINDRVMQCRHAGLAE